MDDADEDAPSWPPRDPAVLEKLRRGFPLRMDRQGNFFFEDDPNDFGNDNDDTFVIHQVTLEFLIGWYF